MSMKVQDARDLLTPITCDFSPDRVHRYRWTAEFHDGAGKPTLAMCALNPSTADEWEGDPTVNRMVMRARRGGYGRFEMVNCFAFRSTDPKGLYDLDPETRVGLGNDGAITKLAERVAADGGSFVCGWGVHAAKVDKERPDAVLALLRAAGVQPMAYKVTKAGHPSHPLYLGYSLPLVPYPPITEPVAG